MRPLYAGALTAAAIVGVAIGVGLHSTLGGNAAARPPSLPDLHGQATWRPNARPAPPVALRDQHRRLVSLRSLRGSTVVLTFMDSLCKQACPIEGRMLASAIRQVSPRDRPQLVVVSVDPAGDSAASVARAARKWTLPHDVIWLLGTQRQLARIWRAYDITVEPVSGDIVHSTALYLIDKRGDERAGFLLPFVPGLVADDLRRLGAEPA